MIRIDAGDGEGPAFGAIGDRRWPFAWYAGDIDPVPLFGVAAVAHGDIVVLAPEVWDRIEALALAEHVACGSLSLALRDDPVLDAHARPGVRIGPPGDVASGVDTSYTRFQVLADAHAAIDREPGCGGELRARAER